MSARQHDDILFKLCLNNGEKTMSEGNVYVLINEAMPGYVKVGKTAGPVTDRMKALDSTGVPLPF